MTGDELRARLSAVELDPDPTAEERAWQAIAAAYRSARPARRRLRWQVVVPALGCLLALVAGLLVAARPQRDALAHWLRTAIGLGAQPRPRPLLAGLPSHGLLLVNAGSGPWIVGADGGRRYLGGYRAGAWSPHTLYVAAWGGPRLAVLDPRGRLQWELAGAGAISTARWSPDGYRITYLAAGAAWVVAGDGSGEHRLPGRVAPVVPAWEPHVAPAHRLALVDGTGDVEVVDADTGRRLWRARPRAAPDELAWTADGTRLVAIAGGRLTLYSARGRRVGRGTLPAGETVDAVASAHAGADLALTVRPADGGGEDVVLLPAAPALGAPRPLFQARGPLRGLSWSPDDRWLVTASPATDQWILLPTGTGSRPQAVSGIAGQFTIRGGPRAGVPTPAGWQAVTSLPRS